MRLSCLGNDSNRMECEELLQRMQNCGYKEDEVRESIRKRSKTEMMQALGRAPEEKEDGLTVPLNVFLFQEIMRLNYVINLVRKTLKDLQQAINGEIILTPELQDALNAIYDSKPPKHWYVDPSGEHFAWSLPTLAMWFAGLLEREKQLTSWLQGTRPPSYWLTGFFNPQGFLTATKQEITRRHGRKPDGTESKNDKWSLDDVVLVTEVTEHLDLRRLKYQPMNNLDGVFVHGMYLEGCSWDKKERVLIEASPKEIFTPVPVLFIRAETSQTAKALYAKSDQWYDCPVYTKPKRTQPNLVFSVKLRTTVAPSHWVMRGVALLCSKE